MRALLIALTLVHGPGAHHHLVQVPSGSLAAPIQDAAAVSYGHGAVLIGGLTAADTSADSIVVSEGSAGRQIGRIPTALHDSAAVTIGSAVYLFGGGTGSRQLDTILRVDPRTGASRQVGRLPAPSSDQGAARVEGTAYVVGGYTGTRWLDTIVAWAPGREAKVVARLPTALRYAAVTAVQGRVVIVGG